MSPSMASSTRRRPAPQIYEDMDAFADTTTHSDVETALLNVLGPLSDASSKHNMQLNPTRAAGPGSSPTKTDSSSPPRPMATNALKDVKIPPPARSNSMTDSLQKNGSFYQMYQDTAPLPDSTVFSHYSHAHPANKENVDDLPVYHGLPTMPFMQSDFSSSAQKPPQKRALMDSAPLKEKPSKKAKIEHEEPFELPDPSEMPPVHDDGTKPSLSYAELIGMAILRGPNRRLTLSQIYKWISESYSFFTMSEQGWQNSIRHNLSLNKNFIKTERPKDDPGKGNYWSIIPGQEKPFLLGKTKVIRRLVNPDGSAYIAGMATDFGRAGTPAIGQFTLAPNPSRKQEPKIDSAKFPDDADLSSDGTIPASDPALNENEKDDDTAAMPPPPTHLRSSPPPVDIGSSPPAAMPPPSLPRGTPPYEGRPPSTSSRSRSRKQKFGGLNDSGYWSSIESSAARGAAHQLTSDADTGRRRMRTGRAETEIARMRSSSFDSPSKEQTGYRGSFGSSSPLKDDNPLTPAVVFKRPPRPPPSVSPNTNLRNHRSRMQALLDSPAKGLSPLREGSTWSPAFNVNTGFGLDVIPAISPDKTSTIDWKYPMGTPNSSNLFRNAFNVFIDQPDEDAAARGSPEKRSTKRPSLARAATTTGILADITGSKGNSITLAPPNDSPFSFSPFLKPNALFSPPKMQSPLKQSQVASPEMTNPGNGVHWLQGYNGGNGQGSHEDAHDEDAQTLFGVDLPSDGSEEGVDIFQDFGKIGQTSHYLDSSSRANGSPVKKTSMGPPAKPLARPGLGRSHTTGRW